jgi:hypothetical protein
VKYYKWLCGETSATVVPVAQSGWKAYNPESELETDLATVEMRIASSPNENVELLDLLTTGLPFPKILSGKAVEVLGDLLIKNGSISHCPIDKVEVAYFAFRPAHKLNMLDLSNSEIRRSAFVTHVRKTALLSKGWDGSDVFTLAENAMAGVYVTEQFKQRVTFGQLSGFNFLEVCAS